MKFIAGETWVPRQPSPDPSPLSEAGGRVLQFCRYLGCQIAKGVAVGKIQPEFRSPILGSNFETVYRTAEARKVKT